MPRLLTRLLSVALVALLPAFAAFAQVGVQRETWTIPNLAGGTDTVAALVWYPTEATSKAQKFGPFDLTVALGAAPTPGHHPLVMISHGTSGNELGHAWLAQKLAADGYVVVTLRHPGDNYLDRSGWSRVSYFAERPLHVSRVLDQVLADAKWSALIDSGRIAAFGHSAGGHTVLALAGARLVPGRFLAHCSMQGVGLKEDPVLCGLGGFSLEHPAAVRPKPEVNYGELRDPRIRAIVLAAPMVMASDLDSLSKLSLPVMVEYGALDTVLVPRFHAETLCQALPQAKCTRTQLAGHGASFHPGTGPLGAPGNDPAEDPTGFDRRAWQGEAWLRIKDFLAKNLL